MKVVFNILMLAFGGYLLLAKNKRYWIVRIDKGEYGLYVVKM